MNQDEAQNNAILQAKKRLLSIQTIACVIATVVVYAFTLSTNSVVFFASGAFVMIGMVYLFATFSQLVLDRVGRTVAKSVFLIVLVPLKFGLLVVPFLLFKIYGKEALPLFSAGVLLALFPLLLLGFPGVGRLDEKPDASEGKNLG